MQPLFTFEAPGGYYLGVGPTDFATIYNVAPLWAAGTDGTGQAIAVVGETNINPQDVSDFRYMFGLPVRPPNIILNGPDPGITGDEMEADLDVQWSGAVAKGATIDLVVSESTETTAGIDLSALYAVDNDLAPVVSLSYGGCEAALGAGGNAFHNTLWEQAAAEGITVVVAAGDSGSAGCDFPPEVAAQYGLAVSGAASTPFNVAVGGTDFNDASNPAAYWSLTNTFLSQASAKSYIPESTWNDSCAATGLFNACSPPPNTTYFNDGLDLLAGSGGPSGCINPTGTFPGVTCSGNYPKPSWQSGVGVPNDSARDVPDVSLFAGNGMNYSFYVVCQMDANASNGGSSTSCDLNSPYTDFESGAGTSASAQVFAGIMALVTQRYGRQGNANYFLYPIAAQSGASCTSNPAAVANSSCVFYDVTVGNNSVMCQGGSLSCSNTNPATSQYGIMVSGNPATAAYSATAGYDLATGLGSVNVANLVNNWTSNFTPSTTTLSLSTSPITNPITLTHGQPIDFAIHVASTTGTPGGHVSLIAQTGSSQSNVTGVGPFTLGGGSVSSSTDLLPGGSYTVTAHYAGNGIFGASDSTPGIPVTVGRESSLTEVRLVTLSPTVPPAYNVTTAPYGSPYFLRMDVTNSSGQPCANQVTGSTAYPCPTGALTVSPPPTEENPPALTVSGNYILNSQGYAEDQPIQQTPGVYNFAASYAGDNSYTASTSPTLPITITKAPTAVTLSGVPSTVVGGVSSNTCCTITVNTQSTGAAPTLTVQYLINGSTVQTIGGLVLVDSPGLATGYAKAELAGTAPNLPLGTSTVAVQYVGDSNYLASTTSPITVTVTDFSVAVNPTSLDISAPGQSGTATLTITPLDGFTGALNVICNPPAVAGLACTASPSSLSVAGTSAVTSTLTITTTGGSSAAPTVPQRRVPPGFRPPVRWLWPLAGLLALVALLSLATRRRLVIWLFATMLLVTGVWAACGGGAGGGGSIAGPTVTFNPSSIIFGQFVQGSSSAFLSTLLTNTGTALLNISGGAITGTNAGDFSVTNDCLSTLAPGANCTFNVTFTPTAAGTRVAVLAVTDNAAGSPQGVSLTGTGVAPATSLSLSPSNLAFGQVGAFVTSVAQSVTLSNTGTGMLSISGITIANANPPYLRPFAQTNNCPSSPSRVAAGANCTIKVTFTPPGTGLFSASLQIANDALASPQTISLTGTGVTPPGTYPFNVGAASGSDAHSATLSITVP